MTKHIHVSKRPLKSTQYLFVVLMVNRLGEEENISKLAISTD